jgi:hypothetical protein
MRNFKGGVESGSTPSLPTTTTTTTSGLYSHDKWARLKPHCIRCGHFKVDDVRALEAISKPPVHC